MFVLDDATVATVVGTLAIIGAVAKCTGNVVEAWRKVDPPKVQKTQVNQAKQLVPCKCAGR